jgi:glycosyltransferase involved in cell wall biosynthesis
MKAVIAVISDLSTDMRVQKLAALMAEEGMSVTVIGRSSGMPLPEGIAGVRFSRIKVPFRKGPLMYAFFNIILFIRLLFMPFSICVASDLDTLFPCLIISRIFNRKLIYDSHEYFTGQYGLSEKRFRHFIWKSLERMTVPGVRWMITVSNSIADIYNQEYGVRPVVIRNLAPDTGHLIPHDRRELGVGPGELLAVFQGSGIHPGRGAGELISAMALTERVRLLIIGAGDIIDTVRDAAGRSEASGSIIFLPRMPWEEMMRYTMCCDVGLSLDTDTSLNQRYSLPNKVFDYIAAGIPAVVSPLPELSALSESHGCAVVLKDVTPEEIARQLQRLADDPELLKQLSVKTKNAGQELTWEREKLKEQELIRSVIKSNSSR